MDRRSPLFRQVALWLSLIAAITTSPSVAMGSPSQLNGCQEADNKFKELWGRCWLLGGSLIEVTYTCNASGYTLIAYCDVGW